MLYFLLIKGQLQRFQKLISNDRIWPSEHGFEVIFEKSVFVFEIRPSKSGRSTGSILGFTRFPKIIIGKPSSVTSQVIEAPRSVQSAVTAKQVQTATPDGFWKKLWFTVLLITA